MQGEMAIIAFVADFSVVDGIINPPFADNSRLNAEDMICVQN
jgi:hypothetical protein